MSLTTPSSSQRGLAGRLGGGRLAEQKQAVRLLLGMLAVMWVVEIVNAIDSQKLDQYGIIPRNVGHLYGILLAPFLHAGFGHLLGNTIPFVILGLMIAASGLGRLATVTIVSIVISGAGVWLTASSGSETVGASGVIFGFATYLIARGFFDRKFAELVVGAVVGVLFGASLLWDLVPHSGVSWQAHLFGGIGGVLAAAVMAEKRHTDPAT